MTELTNKTVWVTGASSGIGEALAVQAAAQNCKVILTARREAELERVRQRCPDPAQAAVLPADLAALEDPAALAQRAASFFGPIDVLVNNAGASQRSAVMDTSMATYRRLFELDFFAPIALSKAVLPAMIRRGGGHIVVVSSVVGYISSPMRSGYAAAKHALHGFYDALAAEHWRDRVQVTLACPGYVKTDVSINAYTGSGGQWGRMDPGQARGMEAEECARRIWRAVGRNQAEVLIGKEALAVYLKRFFPALFAAMIKRARVT